MTRSLTMTLLLALAFACSAGERREQPTALRTTIDTVAGVGHVTNSGVPPMWRLERVLTLGSVGGVGAPAPDEFGRIASAVLGPDDRVYVADQMNSEVVVFNRDGSFAFRFGRSGKGPGEFGGLYSLAWVHDTLLALDFGAGRVAMFDAQGQWLGQRRHSGSISGSPSVLRLYQTGDDEAFAWSILPGSNGLRRVFIRHTAAESADTLTQLDWNPDITPTVLCDHPNGAISFFDIPFQPTLLQRPAPGPLIAAVETGAYRIAFVGMGGDTVRVVERTAEPVPTTEAEWNEGLAEYREFRDENPGVSCQPRGLERPSVQPPVRDMLVDTSGRLWVEAVTLDGPFWEVFDLRGVLVGRVRLFPRNDQTAPYITHDHIVAVESDSLGVQTVSVYEFGGS